MTLPSSPVLSKVAVVVLNYRGKNCLKDCLASLENLDFLEKEIIVVDNASRDGSLEEAERLFPHFVFVRHEENVGFAKGMNAGIRRALANGADYVWLFNNDAEADEKSLKFLVNVAEKNPQAGLLSPVVTGKDGKRTWFAEGRINPARMRTEHAPANPRKLSEECYESEYLSGCALLVRKEVIKKIGFLDEDFFLYYEDADYSLRARQAGFTLLVVPAARVRHNEQSTESYQKVYHLVYSGLVFFGKHATMVSRPYFWLYVTIRRIKNALDRLLGRPAAFLVSQAYKDYFDEYGAFFLPRLR